MEDVDMRIRVITAVSLLLLLAAPAAAQTDEGSPQPETVTGPGVEVIGIDYAYQGLPTSVPAGTTLTFSNEGTELHELALARIGDDVAETLEELLGMEAEGRDPVAEGLVEIVSAPLITAPGTTAEGSITLDREGRYVAICFIPQGMSAARLEELGVDLSTLGPESSIPPEAQEYFASIEGNPPHVALGMVQEFTVTTAGSSPGALPEEQPAEPMTDASPSPGA